MADSTSQASTASRTLIDHLPPAPDPDALVDGFVDFVSTQGIELYPAQEEAVLEIMAGRHIILNICHSLFIHCNVFRIIR